MTRSSLLLLAALAGFAACGGESEGFRVVGGPTVDFPLPEPPAKARLPAPPAPVMLTPCADGWREVREGELTTCEPWPERGRATCPLDQAHFPGEAGCTRIGTQCPAGDWPEPLPGGALVFVRPCPGRTGDGSIDDPFCNLKDAVERASSGSTVVLSKGTFEGTFDIDRALTLAGACVAETTVTSSVWVEQAGVIQVSSEGVVIRNLRVRGARTGVRVGPNASLDLRDVLIHDTFFSGISSLASSLTGENVVIRDVRPRTAAVDGVGIVSFDGTMMMRRLAIERVHQYGVLISASNVELDDFTVAGVRGFASGISVDDQGTATLTRGVIEACDGRGVGGGSLGRLSLTDVVIRDIFAIADIPEFVGLDGFGLSITSSASADVRRVLIERSQGAGVYSLDSDTRLDAEDLVVRTTFSQSLDGVFGSALTFIAGRANIRRARITASAVTGAFVSGQAQLEGSDWVIEDTRASADDGTFGHGLTVVDGARVVLERARISRNRNVGVLVNDAGSTLKLVDVTIDETRAQAVVNPAFPDSDGRFGVGLNAGFGGALEVERVLVSKNRMVGVGLGGEGTTIRGSDLTIRETQPDRRGLTGRGLYVSEGATAELARLHVSSNREVGIAVSAARIEATDVLVEQTLPRQCADSSCPLRPVGIGISVILDGSAVITRFRTVGNHLAGLQVALGGTMDLSEGEISDNPIGANIQTEGFDLARLSNRVIYKNNGINLDAASVPIPEPVRLGSP